MPPSTCRNLILLRDHRTRLADREAHTGEHPQFAPAGPIGDAQVLESKRIGGRVRSCLEHLDSPSVTKLTPITSDA